VGQISGGLGRPWNFTSNQGIRFGRTHLKDVSFRIDRIACLPWLLPRAPQGLDSERLKPVFLFFDVLHFEDQFQGFVFTWSRRGCDLDVLGALGRDRMESESNTASIKSGPHIRPTLIRWVDPEHFRIKPLHPLEVLYVKHCATQLHIRE